MKINLGVLLILVSVTIQAFAQTSAPGLEGSWSGTLEGFGSKLRIVVTVTKSTAGIYTGQFESIDQGATVPFDTVTLEGDNARFEVKAAGILHEAVLSKDRTELNGKYTQGGQTTQLNFKRAAPLVSATPTPSPTPKPDYSAPADAPYTAEEVQVKTPMGHTLVGTLTIPKGAKRVGAVVTVSGSGRQDRDSNLGFGGYKPFRVLADALGRRGIAVLRMDDRGTGASGGTHRGSTSADFAEDIRAGLAYLRTRPEINAKRLGVMGHSEGALIASMVAVEDPDLTAIVLLAGVADPGRNALAFQIKNQYINDSTLTPEKRAELITAIPQRIEGMMAADPWMKFFVEYDPAATMRRVKTPVLILTGSNDMQAVASQVPIQEKAFRDGGNKDVTAKILPGLNHLFVEDADGFPGNYAKLPQPLVMRADVVETITEWLAKRLK